MTYSSILANVDKHFTKSEASVDHSANTVNHSPCNDKLVNVAFIITKQINERTCLVGTYCDKMVRYNALVAKACRPMCQRSRHLHRPTFGYHNGGSTDG